MEAHGLLVIRSEQKKRGEGGFPCGNLRDVSRCHWTTSKKVGGGPTARGPSNKCLAKGQTNWCDGLEDPNTNH